MLLKRVGQAWEDFQLIRTAKKLYCTSCTRPYTASAWAPLTKYDLQHTTNSFDKHQVQYHHEAIGPAAACARVRDLRYEYVMAGQPSAHQYITLPAWAKDELSHAP